MQTKLCLPQDAGADSDERQKSLETMRKLYAYTLTYDGYIATINKLPEREKPGLGYKLKAAKNLAGLLPSLPSIASKWVKHKLLKKPFNHFTDYLFYNHSPIPNPEMWQHFSQEQYLGYQRVAGMNPVVLEGVCDENPLPETFQVTAEALGITAEKWAYLKSDNRLYVTNYAMLAPLKAHPGEVDGLRKYVMPAIALYEMLDNGQLMPLGAQLDATAPTDSEHNPIITPSDKRWSMVRVFLQAADGTHQELWTHATRIHYVMESIIMVCWRQLSTTHPLMALLEPHLTHTLSVNVNPLFEPAPDGSIPDFGKMFACDNATLVAFMAEGMRTYSFKDFVIPRELEKRYVMDKRLYYPYRDDGLLIWHEIKRFVSEYLSLWYTTSEALERDNELQAWAKELSGPREEGMCNLTDFPEKFESLEQLVEIVAHIIFVATAHHSSVHYPQYECAGYAVNMPFSAYLPPYVEPSKYQEESGAVKFYPPYSMAYEQSFIFYLTNFKVNKMGDYPLTRFDGKAVDVIRKHQTELKRLHNEVVTRNRTRLWPYLYMDPKTVPNSVTV